MKNNLEIASYLCEDDSFDTSGWKKCEKVEYDIHVYVPKIGTKVHNSLEDSNYITDEKKPYVLIGTAGEEWTVQAKKLLTAYKFNNKPITKKILEDILSDGKKHKITAIAGAETFFAKHTKEKISVKTSWGETLKANREGIEHGNGDYLICTSKDDKPNFDDMWVINGLIFKKTYRFI